jgi:serine/threonine protein phosphatase PrpC
MSLHFQLIESMSLAGHPQKPNEDAFGSCANAACVFDGATSLSEPLMPGASDAQWIANFAARRLCAHAQNARGTVNDWLIGAAQDAETSFRALRKRAPRENYETPFASAVIAGLQGATLRVLWFGDCAALLRNTRGEFHLFGDTLDKRELERNRVERLSRASDRGPAEPAVRDEYLPALRMSRNLVNTGDEWLFAPDATCASHAKSAETEVAPGTTVLLASDGFLALMSDYGRYTPEQLYAAAQAEGLQKLGQELRAIELADSKGFAFPRFKSSDDATALLLRIAD